MFTSKGSSLKNNILKDKPNEDSFFLNDEFGLYGVFDGVTRDKEGGKYPNPSPAAEVSGIVSLTVEKLMREQCRSDINLEEILKSANEKVKKFNSDFFNRVGDFPAGAVGVICFVKDYKLRYAYIGDCSGFILRKKQIIQFTQKQTLTLSKHKGEFSVDTIRQTICNNADHECGYGVLNGDSKAMDFIVTGEIYLKKDDIIVIASDGCDNIVFDISNNELSKSSVQQLFEKHCMGIEKDDRTLIIIQEKE